MTVTPVITSISEAASNASGPEGKPSSATDESLPGFNISYWDHSPIRAQKICSALTSLMMDENLRSRADIAKDTTDFLSRQVEDAKRALIEIEAQLVAVSRDRAPGSPEAEAKHKLLMLDHDVAQKEYTQLQTMLAQAQLSRNMEKAQLGEQMVILSAADLPSDPDFPSRPMCALWGMCAGFLLGILRLLWPTARKLSQQLFPISTGTE